MYTSGKTCCLSAGIIVGCGTQGSTGQLQMIKSEDTAITVTMAGWGPWWQGLALSRHPLSLLYLQSEMQIHEIQNSTASLGLLCTANQTPPPKGAPELYSQIHACVCTRVLYMGVCRHECAFREQTRMSGVCPYLMSLNMVSRRA